MPEAIQDTQESVEALEARFRRNKVEMDLRLQEAQIKQIDRALALEAGSRSFGSAGEQEAMEGLYAPEDYIDVMDYRRDNYGYQAYAATFTTKTDRQDGRNWPYWVSEPELAAIRGTVRLLAAYNKTCFGILNKLRNYTIGSQGFTRKVVSKNDAPKSLLKQIDIVLDEFDSYNKIIGDLDQEAFIRDVRDGEVALSLWHQGDGHVDLRVVEPDQISEPTNKQDLEEWLRTERQLQDGGIGLNFDSNWSFGIHTTKGDVGCTHGFYVQWDGDNQNWDYLPGGNRPCYPPHGINTWLEFRKSNTDRNIKRGVSDFWPVTGDVELARKMIRNLTHAGALQAAIAWIREMAPGTTNTSVSSATMSSADWQTRTSTQNGGTRTSYQQTYQPGTTLYLGANQKFTPPPWVHQSMAAALVDIFEAMLRSISQIWSMPEHMITGSAANNNYASILEAGSPFVKEVETRQGWHRNLWLAVYWKVLWFNWRCGRLGKYAWNDVRHAVEIRLVGSQIDVRDRKQETDTNIALRNAGVMSDVELAARAGLDYDDQVSQGAKPREIQQPIDMLQGSRVSLPSTPSTAPAPEPRPTPTVSGDAGLQTDTTLNGAQIQAVVELLAQMSSKTIVPDAALELLVGVGIPRERAQVIINAQSTKALPPQAEINKANTIESLEDSDHPLEYLQALAARSHVDINGLIFNELRAGVLEEMEHDGAEGSDTKVISSEEGALKIAVAHLREDPNYYSKLKSIGLAKESCDEGFHKLSCSCGVAWHNYP